MKYFSSDGWVQGELAAHVFQDARSRFLRNYTSRNMATFHKSEEIHQEIFLCKKFGDWEIRLGKVKVSQLYYWVHGQIWCAFQLCLRMCNCQSCETKDNGRTRRATVTSHFIGQPHNGHSAAAHTWSFSIRTDQNTKTKRPSTHIYTYVSWFLCIEHATTLVRLFQKHPL